MNISQPIRGPLGSGPLASGFAREHSSASNSAGTAPSSHGASSTHTQGAANPAHTPAAQQQPARSGLWRRARPFVTDPYFNAALIVAIGSAITLVSAFHDESRGVPNTGKVALSIEDKRAGRGLSLTSIHRPNPMSTIPLPLCALISSLIVIAARFRQIVAAHAPGNPADRV